MYIYIYGVVPNPFVKVPAGSRARGRGYTKCSWSRLGSARAPVVSARSGRIATILGRRAAGGGRNHEPSL